MAKPGTEEPEVTDASPASMSSTQEGWGRNRGGGSMQPRALGVGVQQVQNGAAPRLRIF